MKVKVYINDAFPGLQSSVWDWVWKTICHGETCTMEDDTCTCIDSIVCMLLCAIICNYGWWDLHICWELIIFMIIYASYLHVHTMSNTWF